MSILIKGIEKPMSCDDCIVPLSKCDFLQRRADECPIVEIPTPHGRLIDADEFTDVCEILADKGGDIRPWEQAEWIAKDMPTILEAEDEKAYTIQADSDTVSFKNNGENQF